MDKNIPLSELMLIGSKITRKCTNAISSHNGMRTCAIGAMLTAKRGELLPNMGGISTYLAARELGINGQTCHPCWKNEHKLTICEIITSLNDEYGWSRPRIARWLRSIGK